MQRPIIGKRRQRLMLEQPVETPDGIGGTTQSFALLATLWGAVEPLSARDRAEAQRAEGAVTHRITLRFRADLTTAMRLADGARRYRIVAFYDADGRARDLICLVEEVEA